MDLSALDDLALIWRAAHEHEDALAELYDRHGRLILSVVYHIVHDAAVAEEITQEVFVRAWLHADTYDPTRAKVRTWLVGIARHRAIDVVRRISVRPQHNSVGWDELPAGAEPRTESVAAIAQRHITRDRVRWALGTLPAAQREALELAYFQGFTQQEIADALAEPLGTIKTRIRLGMQKLRLILDEDSRDETPS